MVPVLDVANYFLLKADVDAGDAISNLKLQKLLYYAQGFTLALTGAPLFNEPILAWAHGPVVKVIYHTFKEHGANGIPALETRPEFDANISGILDEVYNVYGQFSAWKLRNMTHAEPPWKDTELSAEISHDKLSAYFKTQLVG